LAVATGLASAPFLALAFAANSCFTFGPMASIFLSKLIKAREEAGLTQRDVAEHLAMFHSWVSKTESGDRRLDVMELTLLAETLRETSQLFFGRPSLNQPGSSRWKRANPL
jgi:transcriptional regulator with XRE-family HTH domain